jgi:hypothetical protein
MVAGTTTTAGADLIISELVDGTMTGGLPKWAELTNTGGATLDLSNYSIGNYNNGSTSLGGAGSSALSGQLATCETYIVAYETAPASGNPADSQFFTVYGFAPDIFLGPFINGDDVVAIFLGLATGAGPHANLVDVLGVVGVDGSGQPWEYTDSFARRNGNVVSANPVFNAAEWIFGGPGFLETGGDPTDLVQIQNNTFPGAHDCTPPVPTEGTSWSGIKSDYR